MQESTTLRKEVSVADMPAVKKRIGIVVPTLNQFKLCLEALASIQTEHIWTPYIIQNWKMNLCLAKSWSSGTQQAIDDGCDYIAIINDDILFAPYALDEMVDEFERSGDDVVLVSGCDVGAELPEPGIIYTMSCDERERSISEHPHFSAFMVKKDIFEKVGTFDENFIPAYFEDNDFHYRIITLGYKGVATTKAPFYHYGSATINGADTNPVPSFVFEGNRDYFVSKWGGTPGAETFKHPYNDETLTPKEWIKKR
jgi:hypothetical protein